MFCIECGYNNIGSAKFCKQCGTNLNQEANMSQRQFNDAHNAAPVNNNLQPQTNPQQEPQQVAVGTDNLQPQTQPQQGTHQAVNGINNVLGLCKWGTVIRSTISILYIIAAVFYALLILLLDLTGMEIVVVLLVSSLFAELGIYSYIWRNRVEKVIIFLIGFLLAAIFYFVTRYFNFGIFNFGIYDLLVAAYGDDIAYWINFVPALVCMLLFIGGGLFKFKVWPSKPPT